MEVMEEGNLMDRVPILLQRDLQYYQEHQSVLQGRICPGVVGGKLDFPRSASFAAIKLVLWWEEEYYASHKRYSGFLYTERDRVELEPGTSNIIVKNSDPEKFVNLVTKSAELLLTHLHLLSQESLDHADLSVLTATIGAATLIRNCLKVYTQAAKIKLCLPKGDEKGASLKLSYKQYYQLAEALAERLLDLHCRLVLLYIVQEVDSLRWQDSRAFFESERGSYTVQMWWLYIWGTRNDLWNSVPPKMARRIFAGILNETLGVLTVRYTQVVTSSSRAQLHLVDICNLLFCVAELLPNVCESGEDYIGLQVSKQSIIIRDIHAKCAELFCCLLLRGAPLGLCLKVFGRGWEYDESYSPRQDLSNAWTMFALPGFFPKEHSCQSVSQFSDLATKAAVLLELKVMLGSPEASWPSVIKVLLMRDAFLTGIIMRNLLKYLPSSDNFADVARHVFVQEGSDSTKCERYFCRGECNEVTNSTFRDSKQLNYQIVFSLSYILIAIGKVGDIKCCLVQALENSGLIGWSDCLDKRQIWNQKRPPWLEAMVHFVYPALFCAVEKLVCAVENGASMYQAMSLALNHVSEMWTCIPDGLYKISSLLQDVIPTSVKPLSKSVLMQVIFAGLYTELVKAAAVFETSGDNTRAAICYSLTEAVCSLDEDDKHTEHIDLFFKHVHETVASDCDLGDAWFGASGLSAVSTLKMDEIPTTNSDRLSFEVENYTMELEVELSDYIAEILASDILLSTTGKMSLKLGYNYLKYNKDWLMEQLGITTNCKPIRISGSARGQNACEIQESVLKAMFFIGYTPFDQLLTSSLSIEYTKWLQTLVFLNPERIWMHLARRCDFQEDAQLTVSDEIMIANITKAMKNRKSAASWK